MPHWGHTLPCSLVAPHLHTSRVGASSLELLERLLSLLALETFFFGTAIVKTPPTNNPDNTTVLYYTYFFLLVKKFCKNCKPRVDFFFVGTSTIAFIQVMTAFGA